MNERTREHMIEEAIGWTIRLRDADVSDWEEFTRWLEADPAHLSAYEEVAAIDSDLADLPPGRAATQEPASPIDPPRVSRRSALGLAVAASLIAMVGYTSLRDTRETFAVETQPGERRVVTLERGDRIELNGASRLTLDRGDLRYARLDHGEAFFSVLHDPSAPFRVEVGGAAIRNIGTVFNIVHDDQLLLVEVAEGAVAFRAEGRELELSQGMAVRQSARGTEVERRDPATIGTWLHGQLSYSSAPYSQIAQDLSRNSGFQVEADPRVANRLFSGVITLDGSGEELMRRVSALLEVEADRRGETWVLAPARR